MAASACAPRKGLAEDHKETMRDWGPIQALPACIMGALALLAGAGGCDTNASTRTPPNSNTSQHKPLSSPVQSEWGAAFAGAQLEDPRYALLAALRIVELTEPEALCAVPHADSTQMRETRLLPLNDGWYAFGLACPADARCIHAPVLVCADGVARPISSGAEEECSTLHVSDDADVFPHLVILPHRVVLLAGAEPQTAIELLTRHGLRFMLTRRNGVPYVALRSTASPREVAAYVWDPYELQFTGPAKDTIPDTLLDRFFELDLKESRRLIPRGGQISQPEIQQPPPAQSQPRPPRELEGLPT